MKFFFHMYKNPDKLIGCIKETAPDCVGFSIMTSQHISALKTASLIKRNFDKSILTIFGGPHCTFVPEIINNDSVDIVVRGEGEGALLDIINALDKKEEVSHIKNVYVKCDSGTIENELRPLIKDLDSLPFPDRGLFDNYLYYRNNPNRNIMTSRGCPFKCNFCFNKKYNELYKTKKLVRRRSIDNVISELELIKDNYPATRLIKFLDDMFTVNRKWLYSFLEEYNKKINLPFNCHIRADSETEETIRALAESNCTGVQFGIETGNEQLLKDNKIRPDYWDRVDDMFAFPDDGSDDMNKGKKIYLLSNPLISFPRLTPLFKKIIKIIKSDILFLIIFKLSAEIEFWLRSKLTLKPFLYELMYHYKTK